MAYLLIEAGNTEAAKAVMASLIMNIDSPTIGRGDRLIHLACEKGDSDVVNRVIEAGANINGVENAG